MAPKDEERQLGSQMEDETYLKRLENDWINYHGTRPTGENLVLWLSERLKHVESLFNEVCLYLGIGSPVIVIERLRHPKLRQAIDSFIEPELVKAISTAMGMGERKAYQELVRFSLDSRLMPWHLLKELATKQTLGELDSALRTPEFGSWLDWHQSDISRHFEQVKRQAKQASDHLVQANLRLVIAVAKKYAGRGMPLSDLIQEGNLGLIRATKKFDHRRGYKFSTYATWWIRQSITRSITDKSRSVRLPVHIIETRTKLDKASQRLSQEYGRCPTSEELASELGVSAKKVDWLLEAASREPLSLETPVGEGEDSGDLSDFIEDENTPAPEDVAARSMFREELDKVMMSLLPRERRVIELRFGLQDGVNRTLDEVGAVFGVSRERIRQIERDALNKLRHPNLSRRLLDYLD